MIVVLAGDRDRRARLGNAVARRLEQATVLQPQYFAPVDGQRSDIAVSAGDVPWLPVAVAASAQSIAAGGGACVVDVPELAHVSALLSAFDDRAAPLYLFLLRKPARPSGVFRRAVMVDTSAGDTEQLAAQMIADTAAGRGLIRPAPAASPDSVLPVTGGPSTGVDIIEIARIARVVARYEERFLQRVYTEAEQALYRGRIPELAARFAAKEAVSKALGTGIWGIRWREMEILPDVRGKPLVYLHGAAAARARALGLRYFAISLSHSRDFAVAVVVAT